MALSITRSELMSFGCPHSHIASLPDSYHKGMGSVKELPRERLKSLWPSSLGERLESLERGCVRRTSRSSFKRGNALNCSGAIFRSHLLRLGLCPQSRAKLSGSRSHPSAARRRHPDPRSCLQLAVQNPVNRNRNQPARRRRRTAAGQGAQRASGKWVARATRPCRSATRRTEDRGGLLQ